jgi:hypothetical protein
MNNDQLETFFIILSFSEAFEGLKTQKDVPFNTPTNT